MQSAVNSMIGPEIVVRDASLVEAAFDARASAKWRRYRYTIINRPVPDPFRDRFSWWVPEPLDVHALRLAADPFVGEHDFASFCRKGPEGSSTTRRVYDSGWHVEPDDVLVYEITANAFCWQMVRSIVGTLVDVGLGKLRPGDLMGVLRARDRSAAVTLAPPRGLTLWEVGY
jgi:tRNA pseudouridine38-40 synthase